jgi:hypothetical protein
MADNTFDIKGGNNQILPNAKEAVQHIHNNEKRSARIANDYARLREEIGKEVDPKTKDKVKFYETKIPGTKDVIEKLTDGGFKPFRHLVKGIIEPHFGNNQFRIKYADFRIVSGQRLQLPDLVSRDGTELVKSDLLGAFALNV